MSLKYNFLASATVARILQAEDQAKALIEKLIATSTNILIDRITGTIRLIRFCSIDDCGYEGLHGLVVGPGTTIGKQFLDASECSVWVPTTDEVNFVES